MGGRISLALGYPIPLAQETPPAVATERAADFVRDSEPRAVDSRLGKQPKRLVGLISAASAEHTRWGARILPDTPPESGRLKTAAVRHGRSRSILGSPGWLVQFAHGPRRRERPR